MRIVIYSLIRVISLIGILGCIILIADAIEAISWGLSDGYWYILIISCATTVLLGFTWRLATRGKNAILRDHETSTSDEQSHPPDA